jgi:hypothetical protein
VKTSTMIVAFCPALISSILFALAFDNEGHLRSHGWSAIGEGTRDRFNVTFAEKQEK